MNNDAANMVKNVGKHLLTMFYYKKSNIYAKEIDISILNVV